jgi:UDP-glucose 6-dehydrogenase
MTDLFRYKIIVEKSTVPVKTAEAVEKVLKNCAPADFSFDVLSNPEFLAEVRPRRSSPPRPLG